MKTFSFHAYTIVDALAAGAIVLQLAKGRVLHPKIVEALDGVKRTRRALETRSLAKEQEDDPLGSSDEETSASPNVRVAMLGVRSTFAALAEVLRRCAELPADEPISAEGRRAYRALFPHDTTYLGGSASGLKVFGERMLTRARQRPNAARLQSLGVTPFVNAAAKAFAKLDTAYDASACAPPSEPTENDTLGVLHEATSALRSYAEAVQMVDFVEGTSLHRELLAPLANRRTSKRAAPASPAAPTPELEDTDEAPPSRAA